MSENFDFLNVDVRGNFVILSLSNPAHRNAFTGGMLQELSRFWEEIRFEASCRAIILQGDPEGAAFCSGPDVEELKAAWQGVMLDSAISGCGSTSKNLMMSVLVKMLSSGKPVVAKVTGPAFGLGASIALLADIVVVNREATFCVSPARLGVLDDISAHVWTELLGIHKAKELLLSQRLLGAEEAVLLNLVDACVDTERLESVVLEKAAYLSNISISSIKAARSSITSSLIELIERSSNLQSDSRLHFDTSNDLDAALAYLDKCQKGRSLH